MALAVVALLAGLYVAQVKGLGQRWTPTHIRLWA
jgi:hypothetical protein